MSSYVLMEQSCLRQSFYPEEDTIAWEPPTDLYTTESEFIIRIEVAGLRHEHVTINSNGDGKIMVSGARLDPTLKNAYYQMEVPFGYFRKPVQLPKDFPVDESRIAATYENGFLFIRCPRKEGR